MQPTEYNPSSNYQSLIEVTDDTRAAFYRKTYGHVALATLLFIIVETILLRIDPLVELMLSLTQGWKWLLVLGAFMFATNYAEKLAHTTHDKTKQYLALLLFVVAEAIIFVPLLYIAIFYMEGDYFSVINQAAIMTLALFTGLSAVVLITKKDFSFLRSFLAIGFVIAVGAIVAGMIFGFNLGLVFSAGMIVLAAGTILYQTSQLVHKYSTDQYVGASLGLFASLMLLFWYILSIFMSND
ncbi:Bax inhibitor-1/YccA family protein [Nonlabens marinus]|uniref:Putative TEGT family carrier/transport protein n=1 Tax=Nonlabens marinus S1-08 TaxID=1454201 RepID=W8VTV5_9FLAO|nr:Bax inhibitor-1 family protein [Nonlabens marinus]BAO54038.1 putative TEGT family carrier/transport protein [Nonlabens marinus S1-08]